MPAGGTPPLVDAHLDLAYNVLRGRDLTLEVAEVRRRDARDSEQCMVTLPELRRAGMALVFASVFTRPAVDAGGEPVFSGEVADEGRRQLAVYHGWEDAGEARIVRDEASLTTHLAAWETDGITGLVIAMECAEPIESPDELSWWFDAGVRCIGPAWMPTRYCGGWSGGSGRPTGLTPMGRELIAAMADKGIILDLAHMSTASMEQSLATGHPRIVLTHTSPRWVMGADRFPDEDLLRRISQRGGIIGLGLGNMFLDRDWRQHRVDVSIEAVGRVLTEMALHTGWDHLGLGSDLDGGFGLEETPVELETVADVNRLRSVLPNAPAAGLLGGNWLRFLRDALPGVTGT